MCGHTRTLPEQTDMTANITLPQPTYAGSNKVILCLRRTKNLTTEMFRNIRIEGVATIVTIEVPTIHLSNYAL